MASNAVVMSDLPNQSVSIGPPPAGGETTTLASNEENSSLLSMGPLLPANPEDTTCYWLNAPFIAVFSILNDCDL